ncbi:cell division protein FtsA [Clostridium sp. WILCCON 0269]|uniref:Cell division protein FtsA n=1 Tax=Candidatus Clostridium eludens TaxID=3381663 RepID=A0ABW8SM87_9CLOT
MKITNLNPQDVIFALDIGTRSVIGTIGVLKDKKFNVIAEQCIEHEERAMVDGQIHDVALVANVVNTIKSKLEEDLNMKIENVAIAAAGRFLRTIEIKEKMEIDYEREIDRDIIRSLELTAVKSAQEKINESVKGRLYCVGYSVKNYYLNGYVISNLLSHKGNNVCAEIIATFLPRSVVDSLYSVMERVGLSVVNLTLEPIAAMEAAIPQNLRLLNLALIDIGAGTSDIALSSSDSISAYGMVPEAGDEVTEVIAQNYLVDFNTAEKIKKQCTENKAITYIDVLGLENEVSSEDVVKLIVPTVEKITDKIGSKIIELNGGKSPNAIFLVGGGAHTPKLKEFLAEKLNVPLQRIAIKGREAIADCICPDNSLGSIGVTVLGIALVCIKRLGHDFIDVMLNGNVVSLFNSHKHTVMDVMLYAGINPNVLIGKNGKNIRFTVNGIKRVAFGTLASNAEITINGFQKSIDEEVKEGDNIEIKYAINGKIASPKVIDYVQKIYSISFFINDIIENLEPIAYINKNRTGLGSIINEEDDVVIIFPETLKDYEKYFSSHSQEFIYYLNGNKLDINYIINEGDRIYRVLKSQEEKQEKIEKISLDSVDEKVPEIKKENERDLKQINEFEEINKKEMTITVNGKNIVLKGKKQYIFVDIFNHTEFDLTKVKGKLYLHLNGNDAGYYDKLSQGDIIELGWE